MVSPFLVKRSVVAKRRDQKRVHVLAFRIEVVGYSLHGLRMLAILDMEEWVIWHLVVASVI
jgi:hypothetical protein